MVLRLGPTPREQTAEDEAGQSQYWAQRGLGWGGVEEFIGSVCPCSFDIGFGKIRDFALVSDMHRRFAIWESRNSEIAHWTNRVVTRACLWTCWVYWLPDAPSFHFLTEAKCQHIYAKGHNEYKNRMEFLGRTKKGWTVFNVSHDCIMWSPSKLLSANSDSWSWHVCSVLCRMLNFRFFDSLCALQDLPISFAKCSPSQEFADSLAYAWQHEKWKLVQLGNWCHVWGKSRILFVRQKEA